MYVQIYLQYTVHKMHETFEKHILCGTFDNTSVPQQYCHKIHYCSVSEQCDGFTRSTSSSNFKGNG